MIIVEGNVKVGSPAIWVKSSISIAVLAAFAGVGYFTISDTTLNAYVKGAMNDYLSERVARSSGSESVNTLVNDSDVIASASIDDKEKEENALSNKALEKLESKEQAVAVGAVTKNESEQGKILSELSNDEAGFVQEVQQFDNKNTTELATLKALVKSQAEKINKLESLNADRNTRISELAVEREQQALSIEAELEKREAERAILLENLKKSKIETKSALRGLKHAEARVANARDSYNKRESELDSIVFRRTEALTKDLQMLRKESNKWAMLAISRKNELATVYAAVAADSPEALLLERIAKLEEKNASIGIQNEDILAELEVAKTELSGKQSADEHAIAKLQRSLAEKDFEFKNLQHELVGLKQQNAEMFARLNSKKLYEKKVTLDQAGLIASLRADLELKNKEVLELNENISLSLTEKDSQLRLLKTELEDKTKVSERLQDEVAAIRSQDTSKDLLAVVNEKDSQLQALRTQVLEFSSLKESLIRSHEQAEKDLYTAQAHLVSKEQELEKLRSESFQAQEAVFKLMNEKENLVSYNNAMQEKMLEIDTLKRELAEAREASVNALSNVNSVKLAQINAERDSVDMKANFLEMKSALSVADKRVKELEQRLASKEKQTESIDGTNQFDSSNNRIVEMRPVAGNSLSREAMAVGWYVKAASKDIAFIKNSQTGKSLRINVGFDVPGCGSVESIDPNTQVVKTTKCSIAG